MTIDWLPIDEETYDYRRDALWPACNMSRARMFLLGEPMDHRGDEQHPNAPRFLAHLRDGDGCWVADRPVTVTEFMKLERRTP